MGLWDGNDVGLELGTCDALFESVGPIDGILDGVELKAGEGCEVATDIGDVVGPSVGGIVGENVGKISSKGLGILIYRRAPLNENPE
mmetsp:Transcript_6278/g.11528  ORF Transcript_6278/g.11528 Transcript_6278/m.11528 type:complete len:87 (+) Transcript_6278:993-1253(+)